MSCIAVLIQRASSTDMNLKGILNRLRGVNAGFELAVVLLEQEVGSLAIEFSRK